MPGAAAAATPGMAPADLLDRFVRAAVGAGVSTWGGVAPLPPPPRPVPRPPSRQPMNGSWPCSAPTR